MLLIPCPWCGPRPHIEFSYGGDAKVARPAADIVQLYTRDNPRGSHDELWHHISGCRRWLKIRRDTVTHEVIASAQPSESLDNDTS